MAAPWWKGAVLYQIYPRSFADANGDGIGDIAGIVEKLSYIKSLGVDGIWFSPLFKSPQADFGYDVSDYRDIDPAYGSLAEFDAMLAKAHRLGLKVLLDIVPSHTSEDHPWFIESLQSKDNPKADWYVWADPKPDGTPPNNWLSVFGGPAWSYHPLRRQYYLHIFYKQQPKLNLHNPAVADAVFGAIRFWLDRGVDGFRVDVINTCLHDPALGDNPSVPEAERTTYHWAHAPRLQHHLGDFDWPGNVAFAERLRSVFDAYTDKHRFVLGEVALPETSLLRYVGPKGLHSGYHFGFLETEKPVSATVRDVYTFLGQHPDVWPCVAFSNHDFVRSVTRFGSGEPEVADPNLAKLLLILMLGLKGTVLLYQGEELGLPEADVPPESRQDPLGKLYPHTPGAKVRDGSRTPMPWHAVRPNAGFCDGEPWLPVPGVHAGMAADVQEGDAQSVLSFARASIATRQSCEPLRTGSLDILTAEDPVLVFARQGRDGRVLCAYNFSRADARCAWPFAETVLVGPVAGDVAVEGGALDLSPLSGGWLRC